MRETLGLVFALSALAAPTWAQVDTEPARPKLELSLDDAVKRALENNADIAVERLDPEASAQSVREAQGAYDPFVTSNISLRSVSEEASNQFSGAQTLETDTTVFNAGLSQLLPTGGQFDVAFSNRRTETNNAFDLFNPSFNSGLNLTLTQPLLRDFRIDFARQQVRVAKKNREISDAQFRQVVVNTVAGVRHRYYDLLYAIDNLVAQRKSLDLAKKFLDENQIKVRVGTLAPLDVVAAESEVAGRDEQVILAEVALENAQDALKQSIFPQHAPETWNVDLVPTDQPSAEPVTVDGAAALAKALESRTDVLAARKAVESAQISVDFARNQKLPTADIVAAYGASGVGGTRLERDDFGGEIIGRVEGGYNDALDQLLSRDFPTWTLGINLSYPIRNRTASARAARFQVSRDQAVASLRRLELNVAAEVRSVTRAVEANFKRVAATRAARVLQERRLDAEGKRFAAGMSTNFLVTQAQRDLAFAEVAELRAVADYRKSLVDFERVQEAGGGVILR
jgi:outer membrane protein